MEYRGRVGCRVSQEWGYFLGSPHKRDVLIFLVYIGVPVFMESIK